MLGKNHTPKRGWTMLIVDWDLMPKDLLDKIPWSLVQNLDDIQTKDEREDINNVLEDYITYNEDYPDC